jgi:hypothetical protein
MRVSTVLFVLVVLAVASAAATDTDSHKAAADSKKMQESSSAEGRSQTSAEASVFDSMRSASLLEQSARKARQQARARAKAEAQLKELQSREERFEEVMGTELKSRMDNVRSERFRPHPCISPETTDSKTCFFNIHRRAAQWLFQQGRLEEGATMYARCIEMYGDALAEPYKEVCISSLSIINPSVQRMYAFSFYPSTVIEL